MKILISLPSDRWYKGDLDVVDDDGVVVVDGVPADGKSDQASAIAAGNPTRDPQMPYGDTPIGEYNGELSYVVNTPENRRSYGDPDETGEIPTIDLTPLPGDTQAWRAKLNGRIGLKIHAGALGAGNQLRPTHGCCRLFQVDMTAVLVWVKKLTAGVTFPVNITEKAA